MRLTAPGATWPQIWIKGTCFVRLVRELRTSGISVLWNSFDPTVGCWKALVNLITAFEVVEYLLPRELWNRYFLAMDHVFRNACRKMRNWKLWRLLWKGESALEVDFRFNLNIGGSD